VGDVGDDRYGAGAGRRELHDAREQLSASHDILVALSRAGADPTEILDTVVERAARLCGADTGQLYLVDGDVFRLSRVWGPMSEEFRQHLVDHPMSRDRSTLIGRVAEDRRTQQIPDVLADAEYGRLDLQRLAGYRTLMQAPMILEDEVVGTLSMWRTDVRPFDDREQGLLEELALQGAIVLRQVELTRVLEARGAELAARVAELEALRDVGEAVGSSLDLDEVLERIVTNAVRLTGTDGGSMMVYDEANRTFEVRAAHGSSPELLDRLRAISIRRESTLVGRAATEGEPAEVPDLATADGDPHLEALRADGWRSVLAVPVLRSGQLLGALVIRRRTTGSFGPEVRELLQTFAGQSGLAIVNARLYGELDAKRSELEVASQHKSEFLASMSHELRTPLNAVIGFSEVLLDRMFGDINERQEEYLHDIWRSGRHLLELLNEILDLSKVEAGQMVLEPTRFSVPDALEYALSLVRERASVHRVDLELEVGPEVGVVDADELRFKQVVLNLVSNAVKFTPDGGRVTVAAARRGDELEITVTDTGVGVPPEDRTRIFESFQQGGRGAAKEEGTGLGLTLSRRIVDLFGGRMWLTSVVGEGSTFGVALPLPAATDPSRQRYDGPGSATVLLVDDDRASLDLLSAYLADVAGAVVRARDGVQALELARQLHPAAVVLDIRLPRRSGWEVLAELKADPETAAIPVVVASIVDERQRGLGLGAASYLLKPVRREDLVAALRRAGGLPADEREQVP
jgi:signal transduction histidine kinase/ActR/RegA family two-component response regulator